MPVKDEPPITGPLDKRPDCPGPELMAAYIDGRPLRWGRRRRLEAHFADCDRCFTLLRDIMDFRDADPEAADAEPHRSRFAVLPFFGHRAPRLAWLGAGGFATVGAALLVMFVLRGPANPQLDPLIAALGTQRVTDARLAGFPHGPRPDVLRSTGPGQDISLTARAEVAVIQEQAAASPTPVARHATGVSRVITGDLDTAITDLQHASSADPANARYLNDLAAALLTRGLRRQSQPDLRAALDRANAAVASDSQLLEAWFNRALALDALGQREAAHAAWTDYLQRDSTSEWANEARQRLR
jgi:tetratricopeptide (TPR) repeat protein